MSINNKLHLVKHYVRDLNVDILTFSESTLLEVDGYRVLRNAWINGKIGNTKINGGMGSFVKGSIPLSTAAFSHLNESTNIIECLRLSITKHNLRKFIIGVIYRLPGSCTTVLQQTRRES